MSQRERESKWCKTKGWKGRHPLWATVTKHNRAQQQKRTEEGLRDTLKLTAQYLSVCEMQHYNWVWAHMLKKGSVCFVCSVIQSFAIFLLSLVNNQYIIYDLRLMIWIVVAPDLLAQSYNPAFFCQYLRLKHLFLCFLSPKLEHVDEVEHNVYWQICWNGSRGTNLIHHYVQPAASLLLRLFITRPKKISSQNGSRSLRLVCSFFSL